MCQTIYNPRFTQLRPHTLHESAWIIILLHTFLQGELDPEESPRWQCWSFSADLPPQASEGFYHAEVQKQLIG